MGIAWCKNAVIPLKTRGINTTRQYNKMRYTTFFSSSDSKVINYQILDVWFLKENQLYIVTLADNVWAPWADTKLYTSFESADVWY